MNHLPDPVWPVVVLAAVLLLDAAMSVRPPRFIRDCLTGVKFPEDWWWTLLVIKALAVAGLLVGIKEPGTALAADAGVIAYFLAAGVAHVRARFFTSAFWINCLGMLAVSIAVLLVSFFA